MSRMPKLGQALLKSLVHYEPDTGVFTWLARAGLPRWNGRYAGREAGHDWTAPGGMKYRVVTVLNWPFYAHRLAWLYMTGTCLSGFHP